MKMEKITIGKRMRWPLLASIAIGVLTSGAEAQTTPPPAAEAASDDADIIVTARRREERSLDVPVVITAYSGEQLQRTGVTSIIDIAKRTPQLFIGQSVGGFGGIIAMRGIGSPTSNTASDSAVSINIDGVPIAVASAARFGQIDIGDVQVLKGPQALYFGKNASGGIFAVRSAEPTKTFEGMAQIGYEFGADELNVEGMVSGPVSDNLRFRLAAKIVSQKGYLYNQVPGVADPRGPGTKSGTFHGALTWEPTDNLTVKLKGTYDDLRDNGSFYLAQRGYCPSGVPSGPAASPTITDCKLDRFTARADLPANVAVVTGNPLFRDGVPYGRVMQSMAVADIDWALSDSVALNSISGFYRLSSSYADPIVRGPTPVLGAAGATRRRYLSQEIRLSSTTPSEPFSWMVGGFFQDEDFFDDEQAFVFSAPSTVIPRARSRWTIGGRTLSAFAQAGYDLTPQLNLSAGARYTHERKTQVTNLSTKFIPSISSENVSPEVTLAFKPSPTVNIFASYKSGYKSGSFLVGSLPFATPIANAAITTIDNSYRPESGRGFEAGIKTELFDRALRLDFAAYRYIYRDLQLSSFDPALSASRVTNAASAKIQGLEFSASYSPPSVPGLRLNTALSYNHARYGKFITVCYVGQTIAQGCTIDGPDAGTTPDQQDLSGRQVLRAPDWSGNIGFSYDLQLNDSLKLGLNANGSYESSSFIIQEEVPQGKRPSTFLIDGSVSIGAPDGKWEVSLLGKNLTNRFYGTLASQESLTGVGATTGTTAGSPSDLAIVANRGREVWLRLTLRGR